MAIKHIGDSPELTEILGNLGETGFHSAWSNPEKFFRHIKSLKSEKAWTKSGWNGQENFTGTPDMGAAMKIAEEGWKEGISQIERVRNRIAALYPRKAKPSQYGITGVIPSIPRAVSGNIMNMKSPESRRSNHRPVITLISDMSCNWTIDSKVIANRAAVVAALIDEIEAVGYSVEVVSTAVSKGKSLGDGKNFRVASSVIVKKSDQYADLSRLAFAMGHPSMFRRMIFADWGSEETCRFGLGAGLGYNLSFTPAEDSAFKGNFYIPSVEHYRKEFETEDIAATEGVDLLKKILAKQGCPAFKDLYSKEDLKKVKTSLAEIDDDF